jgi:hypothetical protein
MGREAVHAKKAEWVNPIKRVTPLKKQSPNSKRAEAVLQYVISQAKNDVYGLSYGLSIFDLVAVKEKTKLASDGKHLFFQPAYVLSMYNMGNTAELKRQVIHLTLHGLLGHYEEDQVYQYQMLAWDVMDRQVEQLAEELKPKEDLRSTYVCENKKYMDCGYGMELYHRAKRSQKLAQKIRKLRFLYYVDNHYLWHGKNNFFTKQKLAAGKNGEEKNEGKGNEGKGSEGEGKGREGEGKGSEGENRQGESPWKIAQGLLSQGDFVDLNLLAATLKTSYSKSYGNAAGESVAQLKKADVAGNDYKEVFREFFSTKEMTQEQVDTIDPMLYHYGLELYGNIPIVEPLEVTEQQAFHTIAIAVDTSGSCNGDTARRFLKETCNMIEDILTIGHIERIYIMQCDSKLQQMEVVESVEEMRDFCENIDNWKMKGWGGTSFVPVFEKLNALQEEGEEIDCLFYLTDGCGYYPEKESEYPAFMVLPKQDYDYIQDEDNEMIPSWIRVLKLEDDEE